MPNAPKIVHASNVQSEPDQSWTYAAIAQKSSAVRQIYAAKGISLNDSSVLASLLRQAEALAQDWERGSRDGGFQRLIDASLANRMVEAIEWVKDDQAATEALRRIARSNVALMEREVSQGKDALWELELFARLDTKGIRARLLDPPDIVVEVGFGDYGIACKKNYSEARVESQLRRGCEQLIPYGGHGIVAFNIDDLTPERSLLQSRSNEEAADFLAGINSAFIDRHMRHFTRFVKEGRCDGVLVSTTALADILGSRVRMNTYTQTTLWTLGDAPIETRSRLDALRKLMGGGLSSTAHDRPDFSMPNVVRPAGVTYGFRWGST